MKEFDVLWKVDDARPQTYTVDIDELAQVCENEQEFHVVFYERMDDEFRNRINYDIVNYDALLDAWRAARERVP